MVIPIQKEKKMIMLGRHPQKPNDDRGKEGHEK